MAGLETRIASLGDGPPVLLLHGWPELWYSWRSQMVALANAGFRAVAPDMPGFGETEGFAAVEDYNIERVSMFIRALIDSLTDAPVHLVGHDWGAINAWHFTLRQGEVVKSLVTLSVPLRPHGEVPPTEAFRRKFGERFFYQLYFQAPGRAEAEFDPDPRAIISRLLCSPDTPRAPAKRSNASAEGGGWTDRLGEPLERPPWLAESELDYYVEAYRRSGFAGGLNYYRNLDRNWALMAPYAEATIDCPVLFMAGTADNALRRAGREELEAAMRPRVPGLTLRLLPGYGHWLQQEAAETVNAELVSFLTQKN